jgi:hypothetical protein
MRIRLAISLLIAFFCCDLSALDTPSAIRFGWLIARELGWFVKAGITPAEALQTATTNAAAQDAAP